MALDILKFKEQHPEWKKIPARCIAEIYKQFQKDWEERERRRAEMRWDDIDRTRQVSIG